VFPETLKIRLFVGDCYIFQAPNLHYTNSCATGLDLPHPTPYAFSLSQAAFIPAQLMRAKVYLLIQML
jgi:hypothetical protein